MSINSTYYQWLGVICVIIGLFLPMIVFAQNYSAGTLLQESEQATIFYVAADGQRYRFPNQATYQTWYRDFRRVKMVTNEQLSALPLAKEQVTVHPGSILVQFADGPEIYAVSNGAVLRLLQRDEVIKALYGYHWRDRIVQLPKTLRGDYSVGAPILEDSDFDRNRVIVASKSIDQELRHRYLGTHAENIRITADAKEWVSEPMPEKPYGPTLTALNTNLRAPLRPNFHPDTRYYWLTADNDEAAVQIFVATEDPQARTLIAGIQLLGSSSAPIPLRFGINQISVRVLTQYGPERTYLLIITRKRADNNALLRSLTENLNADLEPAFHSSERIYTVRAAFDEPQVTLYPVVDSQSAIIRINGEATASGAGFSVPIERTMPTKTVIQVTAQSGTERTYQITVSPQLVPSEATYLRSLALDLENQMSTKFTPTRTRYFAQAKANEERVTLTARPWHRSARVIIDSEETESKSVRLFTGRNEISIQVVVPSGQETTYTLTIDRAIR